jgi:tol-pal system protein YbgF
MRRTGLPVERSDGRGDSRARRLFRHGIPLALALPLALAMTGCATKRDIRDMREDLARQEAALQTTLESLQQQNRQVMDTLALATERLLDVRGEMANQLHQLREQVAQVGELTSQVQIRLTQFDQQLSRAMREGAEGPERMPGGPPVVRPGTDPGDEGFDMAVQFYEIGVEQIERNNAATARRAFQTVVDSFPAHPRAPDAQRQIAETHVAEREWDEALRAFDRVVERFPDSDAAPMALFRAGVISQERGNLARARQYFERVISAYPGSDARRLAEEALARLR